MSGGLFDVQCWDLARAFLEDHEPKLSPAELERHTNKLAELIQDTIEGYLGFDLKPTTPPVEFPPQGGDR